MLIFAYPVSMVTSHENAGRRDVCVYLNDTELRLVFVKYCVKIGSFRRQQHARMHVLAADSFCCETHVYLFVHLGKPVSPA